MNGLLAVHGALNSAAVSAISSRPPAINHPGHGTVQFAPPTDLIKQKKRALPKTTERKETNQKEEEKLPTLDNAVCLLWGNRT